MSYLIRIFLLSLCVFWVSVFVFDVLDGNYSSALMEAAAFVWSAAIAWFFNDYDTPKNPGSSAA
ncbi:hypothetical protein [Kiloniella litopenaei]|uniref:hypothetical protein n=1 Tax=Kiloniella litopenaei TaxID=1549748 RepID=UPI0012FF2610|nr:hypothetical protein [Kiloniella litopenaei]